MRKARKRDQAAPQDGPSNTIAQRPVTSLNVDPSVVDWAPLVAQLIAESTYVDPDLLGYLAITTSVEHGRVTRRSYLTLNGASKAVARAEPGCIVLAGRGRDARASGWWVMTGLSITNWGEIGPGDPPEVESKAGDLIRATTKRSTVGTCYGCTMRTTNIGAVSRTPGRVGTRSRRATALSSSSRPLRRPGATNDASDP